MIGALAILLAALAQTAEPAQPVVISPATVLEAVKFAYSFPPSPPLGKGAQPAEPAERAPWVVVDQIEIFLLQATPSQNTPSAVTPNASAEILFTTLKGKPVVQLVLGDLRIRAHDYALSAVHENFARTVFIAKATPSAEGKTPLLDTLALLPPIAFPHVSLVESPETLATWTGATVDPTSGGMMIVGTDSHNREVKLIADKAGRVRSFERTLGDGVTKLVVRSEPMVDITPEKLRDRKLSEIDVSGRTIVSTLSELSKPIPAPVSAPPPTSVPTPPVEGAGDQPSVP